MNIKKLLFFALPLATIACTSGYAHADVNANLQKQRAEIIQAGQKGADGIPALRAALKDSNPLIRRAAVRSLGEIGSPALSTLTVALTSDADDLVRKTALHLILQLDTAQATETINTALDDKSELVRSAAVQWLTGMHPYTPQTTELLKKAQKDESSNVSKVASEALWPYHKDGVSLRNKPAFQDHELSVVQKIPFAEDGWKFQKDPGQTGHEHQWFDTKFDDSAWQDIKIGEVWETQINEEYDGIAWYRRTFTLPEKPEQDGADIVFDGVDESAWVWINGKYIGQHDIGPSGWNKRFAMDVSSELNWGGENQITVRVLDREKAGGIWKPVYLEALKQ